MSQRTVYLNGQFVAEQDAKVSIFDSGWQMGDTVYEVTRTVRHTPFRLREHLVRLRHSLNALSIDPQLSNDDLEQITREMLQRNLPTEAADVDWNIVHDVSRGPASAYRGAFAKDELRATIVVACYPMLDKLAALAPAYESGIDLVVPEQRSLPHELLDTSVKCRSRVHFQLANLQADAKCRGATAVLLDSNGYVTEGTSGNVFFVTQGQLRTSTERDILPGVTRGVVLEIAGRLGIPTLECDVTQAQAAEADEAFVTSTSIGIVHARTFDGRTLENGRIGPITQRLREALWNEIGLDFAAQARAYAARLKT